MKARMFVAALAALVAAPATFAQDAGNGAWTSPYGLLFTLQNVFTSNTIIGDYAAGAGLAGGVGVQKNLAPQRALRVSVNLSRASDTGYETTYTNLATGQTDKSYTPPGPFTSQYAVDLSGMYLMRLSAAKIAPYLGVGGGLSYFQQARAYEDTVNSDVTTFKVDDMSRATSLFAAGTLGVEWRVHSAISLFAEYGLGLDLVTWSSDKNESSTTVKATGAISSGSKTEGSSTTFLNWGTGLAQGGQLGLVAFF